MHVNETPGAAVLAVAQSRSDAGNIAANIARHLAFMEQAAGLGVSFLMFPELSLTGYEPELARGMAITSEDTRLRPLLVKAREWGMTTVVGAPVRSSTGDGLSIAAFILHPDGGVTVQHKQHLHSGEEAVFTAGAGGEAFNLGSECLGLAICADFCQASHPRRAAEAGASIYAASVLISEGGYAHDAGLLSGHARTYRMAVLMANYAGVTGGWHSGGRSALWDEQGAQVAALPDAEEGLLVAQRLGSGWETRSHRVAL
ncbi:carbon-nitrogen hydrolase family protein [Pseudomonas sp. RC10]|uniref:carbon-nitrogen hydrolase family protein n=1 Tax=Pseudomonas bambusae TaxID=3139142 RepID=UPI0031398DFD